MLYFKLKAQNTTKSHWSLTTLQIPVVSGISLRLVLTKAKKADLSGDDSFTCVTLLLLSPKADSELLNCMVSIPRKSYCDQHSLPCWFDVTHLSGRCTVWSIIKDKEKKIGETLIPYSLWKASLSPSLYQPAWVMCAINKKQDTSLQSI